MDFARKQLEKYGWKDGKGLGKNENGISQALKPKLKRSMTGVGHNAASDYTEHWWSTLYNKAASNIEVKEKDGTTKKIKTKDDTGFEITNSTWKLKRKKSKASKVQPQEQYEDFFVRTAVLGSGGSRTERVRESESDDEQVQKDVFKMTDEELFAACEGRTAHKGARHGLKALGKLARIEEQEKLLLQQSRFNGYSHAKNIAKEEDYKEDVIDSACLNGDDNAPVLKKIKKKRCIKQEIYSCKESNANDDNATIKSQEENLCEAVGDSNRNFEDVIVESVQKKRKKKKNKTIDEDANGGKRQQSEEVNLNNEDLDNCKINKKRKNSDATGRVQCDTDDKELCKPKLHKKNKKTT